MCGCVSVASSSPSCVWYVCVQAGLVYTVYQVCCCDYRGMALLHVCVWRGRGEPLHSRTLILCDRDWRGPASDVTTLTLENRLNGCRWTLMNRHSEESNASLISAWIPLQQHFSVLSCLIRCKPSAMSDPIGTHSLSLTPDGD